MTKAKNSVRLKRLYGHSLIHLFQDHFVKLVDDPCDSDKGTFEHL